MNTVEDIAWMLAEELLKRTRLNPLMYAATKEAFLARCAAALEMAGVDINFRTDFYTAHVPGYPSTLCMPDLFEAPDAAWCEAVIVDALGRLE